MGIEYVISHGDCGEQDTWWKNNFDLTRYIIGNTGVSRDQNNPEKYIIPASVISEIIINLITEYYAGYKLAAELATFIEREYEPKYVSVDEEIINADLIRDKIFAEAYALFKEFKKTNKNIDELDAYWESDGEVLHNKIVDLIRMLGNVKSDQPFILSE